MQNAPMSALLPDTILMLAIVVAWLNDTIFGVTRAVDRYVSDFSVVSALVVGVWFAFVALDPGAALLLHAHVRGRPVCERDEGRGVPGLRGVGDLLAQVS